MALRYANQKSFYIWIDRFIALCVCVILCIFSSYCSQWIKRAQEIGAKEKIYGTICDCDAGFE